MGKHTAIGQKTYKEIVKNGGSKVEAREAQKIANENFYIEKISRGASSENDVSDFSNPINNGRWHTSEDL